MKIKLLTLLLLFSFFIGNAQSNDSIPNLKNQDKISYKKFIVPTALITSGILLLNTDLNVKLQSKAQNLFGENFHTESDDYLLFAPAVQIYLGKYLGFESKNDFLHQSINLIIANTITRNVVSGIKRLTKEERPDQSDNLSFPSGHTAIAFTNASLLYYEYKDSNIWYASSGFLFASATGILRIANNKHYTSDVLAGAGIGIVTGLAVSYWNPFKSVTFGKNKKTTALIYPQIGHQIGLGLVLQPQ